MSKTLQTFCLFSIQFLLLLASFGLFNFPFIYSQSFHDPRFSHQKCTAEVGDNTAKETINGI